MIHVVVLGEGPSSSRSNESDPMGCGSTGLDLCELFAKSVDVRFGVGPL